MHQKAHYDHGESITVIVGSWRYFRGLLSLYCGCADYHKSSAESSNLQKFVKFSTFSFNWMVILLQHKNSVQT